MNFFKSFKYKTIYISHITINYIDDGLIVKASIIFQTNGRGGRRLRKMGSLFPSKHENHQYWRKVAIPWKEGLIDYSQI